jgi:hypothetical protein
VNSCIDGDGSNPFFKNFISVFNTSAVDDCCMCFGLWILLFFASRLYISSHHQQILDISFIVSHIPSHFLASCLTN